MRIYITIYSIAVKLKVETCKAMMNEKACKISIVSWLLQMTHLATVIAAEWSLPGISSSSGITYESMLQKIQVYALPKSLHDQNQSSSIPAPPACDSCPTKKVTHHSSCFLQLWPYVLWPLQRVLCNGLYASKACRNMMPWHQVLLCWLMKSSLIRQAQMPYHGSPVVPQAVACLLLWRACFCGQHFAMFHFGWQDTCRIQFACWNATAAFFALLCVPESKQCCCQLCCMCAYLQHNWQAIVQRVAQLAEPFYLDCTDVWHSFSYHSTSWPSLLTKVSVTAPVLAVCWSRIDDKPSMESKSSPEVAICQHERWVFVTGLKLPIEVTLAAQKPFVWPVTDKARFSTLPHTIALNELPMKHLIMWGTENLQHAQP